MSETIDHLKHRKHREQTVFVAEPQIVEIEFSSLNKTISTVVKLLNVSNKGHRMHIITPKSDIWKVLYTKKVDSIVKVDLKQ
jgi:hypothetical protein